MFSFFGGKVVLTPAPAEEVMIEPVQQLLPAPRSEENQLKDFHEGLRKLHAAIQRGTKTRDQLKEFQKQGSWDSFWGGLSGRNDKDLAHMLTDFGASLEVTQSVVQLVTQVHTVNNNVLRGFNDALVREIERLQADTQTLDSNQNGALVVLYEFKHQIDELLALADGYEYCRQAVNQLATAQNTHEAELQALNLAFVNGTQAQEQQAVEFKRQLDQHKEMQAAQQQQIERLTKLLGEEIQARERLAASLEQTTGDLSQRLGRVEPSVGEWLESQQQARGRIEQLEAQMQAAPGWLQRHVVALIALVMSGTALALSFLP